MSAWYSDVLGEKCNPAEPTLMITVCFVGAVVTCWTVMRAIGVRRSAKVVHIHVMHGTLYSSYQMNLLHTAKLYYIDVNKYSE